MVWGGTEEIIQGMSEPVEDFQARCRLQAAGETDEEYARRLSLIKVVEKQDRMFSEVRPMWKAFQDTLVRMIDDDEKKK